jgi:hypothetical protein
MRRATNQSGANRGVGIVTTAMMAGGGAESAGSMAVGSKRRVVGCPFDCATSESVTGGMMTAVRMVGWASGFMNGVR